ncbi:hypothetical protein IFM89_039373 [Coptis chinensis]|uniref:NAC domain-containing protein n=1 Tax=Coptis chinensis TaxID=261450 RepID=A0A835HNA0_9MAGN|nr:hypothetical protein IFM89_039373 [Coptis chinensis]
MGRGRKCTTLNGQDIYNKDIKAGKKKEKRKFKEKNTGGKNEGLGWTLFVLFVGFLCFIIFLSWLLTLQIQVNAQECAEKMSLQINGSVEGLVIGLDFGSSEATITNCDNLGFEALDHLESQSKASELTQSSLLSISCGENDYQLFLDDPKAAKSGYWKATGECGRIFTNSSTIGSRSTLEFYTGQAPNGMETYWIMQYYRTDQKGHSEIAKAKVKWADDCGILADSKRYRKDTRSTVSFQGLRGSYMVFLSRSSL